MELLAERIPLLLLLRQYCEATWYESDKYSIQDRQEDRLRSVLTQFEMKEDLEILHVRQKDSCRRVLNGELYAQRLQKLIYLYLSTGCFVKISLHSSGLFRFWRVERNLHETFMNVSRWTFLTIMYRFKSKIDLQVTKPQLSPVKDSNPRPLEPKHLPGCLYSDDNLVSIWIMITDIKCFTVSFSMSVRGSTSWVTWICSL